MRAKRLKPIARPFTEVAAAAMGRGTKSSTHPPFVGMFNGSLANARVFERLLHWSIVQGFREFYKFISPCKNPFYKKGDSLEEETWMTRRQIRHSLAYLSCDRVQETTGEKAEKMRTSYVWRRRGGGNLHWYDINYEYFTERYAETLQNKVWLDSDPLVEE